MADSTADSVAKAPAVSGDSKTASKTDESLPPITKEPAAASDASMVPSAEAISSTLAAKASEGPSASADVPKTETGTAEAPSEKPAEPAPTPAPQATTTETATSGNSAPPNGEAVKPPLPVTVEEVKDQDMPDVKAPQPENTTGGAPEADAAAPTSTENASAGDKRKAEDEEPKADASVATEESEPAEKKQKTNGTATNGATRKPGRPKKEQKASAAPTAPAGRTARKTRSQGAADAL